MILDDPKVFPPKSCTIIEMDKYKRKSLFNMAVTSILYSSSSWTIRAPDQYYTSRWKQIFQAIQSTKIKTLILDFNERPTILKHIVNIHFTDLKELWLHGNNILTIETLAFISMEKLVCLSLSRNHITNAETLSKCKYSELTEIYFENNKCLKLSTMGRCSFNKMSDFVLEYEKKNPTTLQSVNDLAKIQMIKKATISKRSLMVGLKGMKRIMQRKVYESFNKGFKECTILISPEILTIDPLRN